MTRLHGAMGALSAAAVLAPMSAAADGYEGFGRGYEHMMWGTGYGMFGGLMMVLFWGVIILAIVFAVKWFGQSPGNSSSKSSALDILSERFARGEIDEEEYRKRKQALEG